MKRTYKIAGWLAVGLTAVLILTAVGCDRTPTESEVRPVTAGFSAKTDIDYGDMHLSGTLTRSNDGKLTVKFTLPTSLSGVAVGWDGENMTMELAGMSITVDPDTVPDGALLKAILPILAAEHPAGELTADGYLVAGETEGYEYCFLFDSSTGFPRKLTVTDPALTAVFSDATALSADAG